jgi:hypothetical protein
VPEIYPNSLLTRRKDVFHCRRCSAVSPINSVWYLKRILHRYTEYFFTIYNHRGIRQKHHENITERNDLPVKFYLVLKAKASPVHMYQHAKQIMREVNMVIQALMKRDVPGSI